MLSPLKDKIKNIDAGITARKRPTLYNLFNIIGHIITKKEHYGNTTTYTRK